LTPASGRLVPDQDLPRPDGTCGERFERSRESGRVDRQVKDLGERRVVADAVEVPFGVLLVVSAVARAGDLQLLRVERRVEHERFEVAVGDHADAAERGHSPL
jgi:hypothetical protein